MENQQRALLKKTLNKGSVLVTKWHGYILLYNIPMVASEVKGKTAYRACQ